MNTSYHITVINEHTKQDVLLLPITKKSLLLFFSTILVSLFILFSIFIFFSPLKYYLPGYNVDNNRKQILVLQKSTDSLFLLNKKREAYIVNLINVVKGDVVTLKDTTTLTDAKIKAMQIQELASIKSANALRKTLPPPPKKDTLVTKLDSLQKK